MPYRHAHWFVLAIFPLAALAFWPSYLAQVRSAGIEMHAHGITASLWVALLAFQSWSIQRGEKPLHRAAGMLSLALFPLFLAGGVSIFIGMAQRFATAASPFHVVYAPRLAWLDVASVIGISLFYFFALRHRANVQLHARYLLATPLFLIPPVLSRLSPFVPALQVRGPDEIYKIGYGVLIATTIATAIALFLAVRSGRHGRPFFITAGLLLVSMVLFETVGRWPAWQRLFARFADVPVLPAVTATFALGAFIAWAGWIAGGKTRPAVPQPA
jgi:hypothetical protein